MGGYNYIVCSYHSRALKLHQIRSKASYILSILREESIENANKGKVSSF